MTDIEITYSSKYLSERKRFLKNNVGRLSKTIKTIRIFTKNPQHPSLHLEKLKGNPIWTMRIDKGNRIFFSWVNDKSALFLDIGPHDKYRRY